MYIEKFSDEVFGLIEKIVASTERINSYRGQIPAIETDLALEDIRRLYDCFILVRELNSKSDFQQQEYEVEQVEDISDQEEVGEDQEENVKEEFQAETIEKVAEESIVPPVEELPAEPTGIGEASANVHDRNSGRRILADKLKQGENRSINDIIAANLSDKSISSRMQHNPISNLKSAIGINEKFIFVYELFGGNTQKYSEMIDKLNSMPGRNEAIALMESLRNEYRWDIENMAFQKLVDMVTRRYS